MDGTMIQHVRRLKAYQVKRLPIGTIVKIMDLKNGICKNCRLVQYKKEKRLQSMDREDMYFRIKEMYGHGFYLEE